LNKAVSFPEVVVLVARLVVLTELTLPTLEVELPVTIVLFMELTLPTLTVMVEPLVMVVEDIEPTLFEVVENEIWPGERVTVALVEISV
jgi:hypothetical protein